MATIAELRDAYPDFLKDKSDTDIVRMLAEKDGLSLPYVAYELGLDPAEWQQNEGFWEDTGSDVAVGVSDIPGVAAGIVDLVNPLAWAGTDYTLSKGWDAVEDATGLADWRARQEVTLSPERLAQEQAVAEAFKNEGLGAAAWEALTSPRAFVGAAARSLPASLASGFGLGMPLRAAATARGMDRLAKVAPWLAEGAHAGGAGVDQATEAGVDPAMANLVGLGTGVTTGALGGTIGATARRFGIDDVQAAMAGAGRTAEVTRPLYQRIPMTAGVEMAQEVPQSGTEQMWQNYAQGKPLMEDVAHQAVMGGLAGGVMGAGFGLFPRGRKIDSNTQTDLLQDEQQADPAQPGINPPSNQTPNIDPLAAARQRQIDAIMGGETYQTIKPGQADPGSLQGLTREQINQRLIDAAMGGESARTFAPGQYPSDVAADLSQQQAKVNAARAAEQAKKAVEKQYEKAGWQKTPEKITLLETAQAPKLVSGIYGDEARKFVDSVLTMDAKTAGELFTNLSSSTAKSAPWKAAIAKAHLTNLAQQEAQTLAQQAKQNAAIDGPGVPVTPTVAQNAQPVEGAVPPAPTTSSVVQPDGVKAVPEGGTPPVVPVPPPSPTTPETPTNALSGQTTPQAGQETGTTAPGATAEPGVIEAPPAPTVTPEQERVAALLERAKNNEPLERFEVSDLVESVGRQVLLEDLFKTSTKNWVKPREGEAPEQTQARRDTLMSRVVNLIQKRHGMGPYEGSQPASLDNLVWDFIERDEKGSPVMRDGKYVSLFDSARSESGTYTHQTLSNILDKVEAKLRQRGVPLPEIPKQANKDTKTKVTAGKRVAPTKVDGTARRTAIELGLQSKALKAKLDELAKPEKRQEFERVLVEALNQRYGPTPKTNPKADGLGLMGLYQQPRLAAAHVDTFNELDQMLRDDPVFQTTFRQNAGVDFNQVDVPAPGQTRAARPRFGSSSVQAEGGLDDNTRTREDTTPSLAEDRRGGTGAELGYDDNVEGELDEDGAPVKGGGAATGMRAGPGTYTMWAKVAGYLPDKVTDTTATVVESQPFARAKQELNALPKNLKQTWISATNGLRLKNLTENQLDSLRELYQTIQVESLSGAGVLRGVDPGVESDRTGASVKDNAWSIGTRGMKNAPALKDLDQEAQDNFETLYENILALPDANREAVLKKLVPAIVEDHNARTRTESAVEGAVEAAGRPGGDATTTGPVAPETGQADGTGTAGDTVGTGTGVGTVVSENRNTKLAADAARIAERRAARKKAAQAAQAAQAEPQVQQGLGEDVAATNPTTEQTLRDTIASLLGKGHNWRIHVYATPEAAHAAGHTPRKVGNAYGWVEADQKGVKHAYFIVNRIEQGTELGKFLHEVGAHIGLENILSEKEYAFLYDKILDWFVAGEAGDISIEAQAALSAAKRVKQAKKDRERAGGTYPRAEEMSELIAYFVEEAVNTYGVNPTAGKISGRLAEWFRKLITAFKRALGKLNIDNLDALTPQDVVDLAYGAARLSLVERKNAAPQRVTEAMPTQYGVDIPSHITSAKEAVHNALSDTYTGASRGLLGWMGINNIAERFGDKLPVLKDIEKTFNEMSHQAQVWLDRGDQIERMWSMLTPKQMELANDIAGNATLQRFDPSKDKADTPEKQEIAKKWQALKALDAVNPKVKGTTVILAAVKHYRDVMQESLDHLEDVLKQAQAAGASTHAIESLKTTVKSLKKKQTHFWLPLHRFGDFHSVGMSTTLFALHQRYKQHLDDVRNNAANPAAWSQADEKLYQKLRTDPKHYEVVGHDSERAARRHAEKLQAKGWKATSNINRFTTDLARAHLKPELEAFEKMLAHTKIDPKVATKLIDSYTDLLIEALPDGHILKHQLEREGIAGWDKDMKRAFAKTAQSQAYAVSRMLHTRKLSEQLDKLNRQGESFQPHAQLARDLHNELLKQQELAVARSEDPYFVRFATGFNYMSMLGGSPFFWALQLAQVPTITLPYLIGRNGANVSDTFSKLTAAWKQATGYIKWSVEANEWRAELDFARAVKGVSKEELEALKEMDRAGRFVFTIGQDLGAAAEGRNTKTARFIRSLNAPTQTTELINRVSTGLAAYRISRKNNDHAKAVEFALRTVDNTQVNMDPVMGARNLKTVFGQSGNLSRSAAKIIFQFWKFQQGMAYTTLTTMKDAWDHPDPALRKQARDSAIGLTISLITTSGIFGLPFVGTGMMLLSFLFGLDGDDDEDDNVERMAKNWIRESPLPKVVADTLNKGFLSAILPTDSAPYLSPRFSLGNLMNPLGYARFDDAERGEDVVKEVMFRVLGGPTGSSAAAFWDGIQAGLDGDYAKATEKMVPLKLMRDLARAYTLADQGVSTGKGEERIDPDDMSTMSWIWQAMGVTPMKKAMYHEGQAGVQALKTAVTGEREKLLARHAQARLKGEDVSAVTRDTLRFNQKHPYARIKAENLRQAFGRRRDNQRKLTDTGILADKQNLPYLGNAAWTR